MNDLLFQDSSISGIWIKMFDYLLEHKVKEMSPVQIRLEGFNAADCELVNPIRKELERALHKRGLNSINTVANTIFPASLYKLARFDRQKLYDLYLSQVSRMKAIDTRNKDGLYFERLISFDEEKKKNQLEFIISEFNSRRGVRRSLLQAAIFDPNRDHKRQAQIGFPCLQHVSFTYSGTQMSLNAFYATQQLFDKAYGNMLGLVRLGNFMAKEMGLSLHRINCFIGIEKLERISKRDSDIKTIMEVAKQHY